MRWWYLITDRHSTAGVVLCLLAPAITRDIPMLAFDCSTAAHKNVSCQESHLRNRVAGGCCMITISNLDAGSASPPAPHHRR